MITYSPRAAKALAYLKTSYNDVDIFVEDKGGQNMWLRLLRPLLPKGKRLSSVNLLGGRESVIAACRLDQAAGKRKRLYIIDGDFDFLLGKPKLRLKRLHRIPAYCIENLLIQEHSLIQIGISSQPQMTEQQIAHRLNFSDWYSSTYHKLRGLFAVYATAHALAPSLRTSSLPISELYVNQGQRPPLLSTEKIQRRAIAVARQVCSLVGQVSFNAHFRAVRNRIVGLDAAKVVSGKSYLLPFLLIRLTKLLSYREGIETLKVRLAENWRPELDPWLARRLSS